MIKKYRWVRNPTRHTREWQISAVTDSARGIEIAEAEGWNYVAGLVALDEYHGKFPDLLIKISRDFV